MSSDPTCDQCRVRRTRCDRNRPCDQCTVRSVGCSYEYKVKKRGPPPRKKLRKLQLDQDSKPSTLHTSSPKPVTVSTNKHTENPPDLVDLSYGNHQEHQSASQLAHVAAHSPLSHAHKHESLPAHPETLQLLVDAVFSQSAPSSISLASRSEEHSHLSPSRDAGMGPAALEQHGLPAWASFTTSSNGFTNPLSTANSSIESNLISASFSHHFPFLDQPSSAVSLFDTPILEGVEDLLGSDSTFSPDGFDKLLQDLAYIGQPENSDLFDPHQPWANSFAISPSDPRYDPSQAQSHESGITPSDGLANISVSSLAKWYRAPPYRGAGNLMLDETGYIRFYGEASGLEGYTLLKASKRAPPTSSLNSDAKNTRSTFEGPHDEIAKLKGKTSRFNLPSKGSLRGCSRVRQLLDDHKAQDLITFMAQESRALVPFIDFGHLQDRVQRFQEALDTIPASERDEREPSQLELLMLGLCALSSRFRANHEPTTEKRRAWLTFGRECFWEAVSILQTPGIDSTLTLLQALCVLQGHAALEAERTISYTLFAVAVSLLLELGGHRSLAHEHRFPLIEIRALKGCFWYLYIHDRFISVMTGRPLRLYDEDCDAPFLHQYSSSHRNDASDSNAITRGITFDLLCKSVVQLGRVVSTAWGPGALPFDRCLSSLDILEDVARGRPACAASAEAMAEDHARRRVEQVESLRLELCKFKERLPSHARVPNSSSDRMTDLFSTQVVITCELAEMLACRALYTRLGRTEDVETLPLTDYEPANESNGSGTKRHAFREALVAAQRILDALEYASKRDFMLDLGVIGVYACHGLYSTLLPALAITIKASKSRNNSTENMACTPADVFLLTEKCRCVLEMFAQTSTTAQKAYGITKLKLHALRRANDSRFDRPTTVTAERRLSPEPTSSRDSPQHGRDDEKPYIVALPDAEDEGVDL